MALATYTPQSSLDNGTWEDINGDQTAWERFFDATAMGLGCSNGSPYMPRNVWVNFRDINIPQGSVINSAWVTFHTYADTEYRKMTVDIVGFDYDTWVASYYTNQDSFCRWMYDLDRTTEKTYWHIDSGTDVWGSGTAQVTPDIVAVIQEIIDRPGYAEGNNICLGFECDPGSAEYGYRRVYCQGVAAIYGSELKPTLNIDYYLHGVNTVIFSPSTGTDDGRWSTSSFVHSSTTMHFGDYYGAAGSFSNLFVNFRDITLPANATILSAKIDFNNDAWMGAGDEIFSDVRVVDEVSPTPPASIESCDNLVYTANTGTFNVPWASGFDRWTEDISDLVNDVISKDDWASGESMLFTFIVSSAGGGDYEPYYSWDGRSSRPGWHPPRLYVSYEVATVSPEPSASFTLGTSDYSDRVIKYGKIKRTANDLRSGKMTVDLANADQHFNSFHTDVYKTAKLTGTFAVGFADSGSSTPSVRTVFEGTLREIEYKDAQCKMTFRDRLFDLTDAVVGDDVTPVEFSDTIPTDIFWTLCTCYGRMSTVESTSNPDIDYAKFLASAAQFSGDSILNDARYTGQKVTKCLAGLAIMNASVVFCDGSGKLIFDRFYEASSLDTLLTADEYTDFQLDVAAQDLINTQWVFGGYDPVDDEFDIICVDSDATSVNTFGFHEQVLEDNTVWFPTSAGAINRAQREVFLYNQPPKVFKIGTGLFGLNRDIGETLRLVNSFHAVNSASAYRITEFELDLNTGKTDMELNTAAAQNAIFLFAEADDFAYTFSAGSGDLVTGNGEDCRLL